MNLRDKMLIYTQQTKSTTSIANLIRNQVQHRNSSTFVKCNYKYKRRNTSVLLPVAFPAETEMNETATQLKVINEEQIQKQQHRLDIINVISAIFNILIINIRLIMPQQYSRIKKKFMAMSQEKFRKHEQNRNKVCNGYSNNGRIFHRYRCDKLSTITTATTATTPTTATAATTIIIAHKQKLPSIPYKSNSSYLTILTLSCRVSAEISLSMRILFILMTLLMVVSFAPFHVHASACWQTPKNSKKCSDIFSLNTTKSECCGLNQEFFYTDRELTEVEYFFARTLEGGMECAPCIESCNSIKCGPNKKCIKRKGKPKCICAPECGAAGRRKQQQQHKHHSRMHQSLSILNAKDIEILPRDVRSLSSEITNINLGLNLKNAKHYEKQHQQQLQQINGDSSNQRNKRILQRHKNQGKPQNLKNRVSMKSKRLLITANVQATEKPTTRRIQILSNIEMPPYPAENRRNHNDDLTRSAVTYSGTLTSTELDMRRHNSQSRHMSITNEANDLNSRRFRQRAHDINRKNNNDNNNGSNTINKGNDHQDQVRHIQQIVRTAAYASDYVQQQQQQQKTKHKHHHRDNKNHKKRRQHKLKDQQANYNTTQLQMTTTGTTRATTTNTKVTSTVGVMQTGMLQTKLPAKTTATATPVNSTMSSAHRHTNNNEHGSEIATLSLTATTKTANTAAITSSVTLHAVSNGNSNLQSRTAAGIIGKNVINFDHFAFDDNIYGKFNQPGFPVEQEELHLHHHAHPVCGTDGRTYNTECQLKKRACRTDNPNLQVAYRGHCRTSCNGVQCLNGLTCVEDHYMVPHCIACKIDCPWDDGAHDLDADGQPDDDNADIGYITHRKRNAGAVNSKRAVCGVDGKTYKSICDINRMICKIGRAIAVAYPGPCRADRITCEDINCGPKNVCLLDLRTHEPRCVSCRYKCSRKRHPMRYEDSKICGVNNRTYNSWCQMRKDSCATGYLIDVKAAGVCH